MSLKPQNPVFWEQQCVNWFLTANSSLY